MATIISAKELAVRLETDPRTVRKFLRSHFEKDAQPGKGSRYAIEAKQVRSLKKAFTVWDESRKPKAEVEEPAAEVEDEIEIEVDEA